MWTMSLSKRKPHVSIAFALALTAATALVAHNASAKPYACGKQTCTAHPTKTNCEVCKSAVCDKTDKGQEVLVPGTATQTKCTEPATIETPPSTQRPPRAPATKAPVERPPAR